MPQPFTSFIWQNHVCDIHGEGCEQGGGSCLDENVDLRAALRKDQATWDRMPKTTPLGTLNGTLVILFPRMPPSSFSQSLRAITPRE